MGGTHRNHPASWLQLLKLAGLIFHLASLTFCFTLDGVPKRIFTQEVVMFGPDPAVLFWMPIGIMIIVFAAGFGVYYYATRTASTVPSTKTDQP